MRWLLLVLLAPSLALAASPRVTSGSGSISTGPRILGEPSFAFELDALSQSETSRPGWPVTTTRAGSATCIGGGTVAANVACVSAGGLECFAAGTGGRTAGDVHKVSTAGFPVASGDFRFQYTPGFAGNHTSTRILLDTRPAGLTGGFILQINTLGTLRADIYDGAGMIAAIEVMGITWDATTYDISLSWVGTSVSIARGSSSGGGTLARPMAAHNATATLGASNISGGLPAMGSIRLLRVSP